VEGQLRGGGGGEGKESQCVSGGCLCYAQGGLLVGRVGIVLQSVDACSLTLVLSCNPPATPTSEPHTPTRSTPRTPSQPESSLTRTHPHTPDTIHPLVPPPPSPAHAPRHSGPCR
jgi:hypothetical protein